MWSEFSDPSNHRAAIVIAAHMPFCCMLAIAAVIVVF
jgi:hypothetical protein